MWSLRACSYFTLAFDLLKALARGYNLDFHFDCSLARACLHLADQTGPVDRFVNFKPLWARSDSRLASKTNTGFLRFFRRRFTKVKRLGKNIRPTSSISNSKVDFLLPFCPPIFFIHLFARISDIITYQRQTVRP